MTRLSQNSRLLPTLPLEGRVAKLGPMGLSEAGEGVFAAYARKDVDPLPNPPLKGEGTVQRMGRTP